MPNLIALRAPSTQTIFSKYLFPVKVTRAPWRKMKSGVSKVARCGWNILSQKARKLSKSTGVMTKGRSPLKDFYWPKRGKFEHVKTLKKIFFNI